MCVTSSKLINVFSLAHITRSSRKNPAAPVCLNNCSGRRTSIEMVSTRLMAGTTPPTCSSRIAPSSSGIGGGVVHQQPIHQQVFLLDLPVELLDKIFAFVGYKKVAQIRVVSRQMNQVCSLVLNSTFQKLQNQIMGRFQNVKGKMPRR